MAIEKAPPPFRQLRFLGGVIVSPCLSMHCPRFFQPLHDNLASFRRLLDFLQIHLELFDQNPHTFSVCLWYWHEVIRCHVDGIPLRLKEFHIDASKNSGQSNVQFCIGKIHAYTIAGTFGKANEIFRERLISTVAARISKPAVRAKVLARRENALVVMLNIGSHADRDARRDGVWAVLNSGVKYTRESLRNPGRKSEC